MTKKGWKSQHSCIRWVLREHLTPPCNAFACGGLEDHHQTNLKNEGGNKLTSVTKDKQTNTFNSKNEGGDELTAV